MYDVVRSPLITPFLFLSLQLAVGGRYSSGTDGSMEVESVVSSKKPFSSHQRPVLLPATSRT